MPRIDYKAVILAFAAEVAADYVIGSLLFLHFAGDELTEKTSKEELEKIARVVYETTAFLPWGFVFGTATTLGGAYLAARIAKRLPYYHGLAMGIIGIVFSLVLWSADATWLFYLGLLLTIPVSLYGAHLAKKHLPEQET
jgi:hypothetical protein